ncbi:MAG TPA: hypothetical protein EYG98_04510 [Sulfurovum sp.]|nr:hypothetical protein [Sulfurovum sp.]
MKKILLMIFVLLGSMQAELVYSASTSLLGQIGEVKITSKYDKKNYYIKLDLKATGLAKSMSGGLVEHHLSKGFIKDGELHAREYSIEKFYKKNRYLKRYIFDYKKKKIKKVMKKWKNGKLAYNYSKALGYFANNDILTLYPNIMRFKNKDKTGSYTIRAAGAEKEGSKLTFTLPDTKSAKSILDDLDIDDGEIVKLFLQRSFLSNGKGNLTFGIGEDGIVKKATLNKLKLFGTLTAKRIK